MSDPAAGQWPGERIFIGLGANLGDAQAAVRAALDALSALADSRCVARSSLYTSRPVDADGPDFVNAVAELRSTLEPPALLAALQAIEQHHGRLRPYRNAPRTLDLDVLLYGDRRIDSETLTVPHPRLHLRAFALQPLADLAPDLVIPGRGPVAQALAGVRDQALSRL